MGCSNYPNNMDANLYGKVVDDEMQSPRRRKRVAGKRGAAQVEDVSKDEGMHASRVESALTHKAAVVLKQ